MPNSAIKSCPFCGEDECEIDEMDHNKFIKFYIKCSNCESTGPMANSATDAIKEWSDRPMTEIYGIVSPKLDNIKEFISEIEDKLSEIDDAVEGE